MEELVRENFKCKVYGYSNRWKPYVDFNKYLYEHILTGDGSNLEDRDYYFVRILAHPFPDNHTIYYAVTDTTSGSSVREALSKETRRDIVDAIRDLRLTYFDSNGQVDDNDLLIYCYIFNTIDEAQSACNLFNKALHKKNKKNFQLFENDIQYYKRCLEISDKLKENGYLN